MITLKELLKIEPQHFQAKRRAQAIVASLRVGDNLASTVLELAAAAGISEATLRRARERAGVRAYRIGPEWVYERKLKPRKVVKLSEV